LKINGFRNPKSTIRNRIMFPDLLLRGLPSLISSGVNLWNRGDNRELQLKQLEQTQELQALRLQFQAAQDKEKLLHQSIEAERNRIAQQENILLQQGFAKEQSATQQTFTLTMEQMRQQIQKQESQFNRDASRENLLLQLEQQRLNQLEIKQLDAELALQLKQLDRETARNMILENRKNAMNPLVNRVEELLIGNGLHVLFAPPTVRGDKTTDEQTFKISETDLSGTLGTFLDRFTAQERTVIFHGGQWQTRAVHSETAARNIHRDLKSEPTIILETFSEGNMYHICVAFWAENWADVRYKRLFKFDRMDVLKGFAKMNTLKRQEEAYSKEDFEDYFGKAAYEKYQKNLELIGKEERAKARGMSEKDLKRSISSKYIANEDDNESVVEYIKLHHAFAVGVLIDEYYWLHAAPPYRRPPLLPQLLPTLLTDYALPPAQKTDLLAQLADFYTQLYDLLRKNGGLESPEHYLELADVYLQLEAPDKARQALEQSARALLQNRCVPQLPNADTAGLAFLTQDLALPYLSAADGAFLARLEVRMRQITDLADYSVVQGGQIILFQQEKIAEVQRKQLAETRRKQLAEAKRKAEEAEAVRIAEAKRKVEEAEAKRKAEAKRLADEAESKRKAETKRLADEAEAKRKAEILAEAKRKEEDAKRRKPFEPEMILVEGGTFQMGGNRYDDEKPIHKVTLSAFSIGKYPITQAQWKAVMGTNPSHFKGDDLPVETVSHDDIQEFFRKLNQLTGKTYRLPTEAQWEFAARGGNKSKGFEYSGSNNVNDVAWFGENSGGKTHSVGKLAANELGIYDMSGNLWEWCADWYDSYSSAAVTNPTGAATGTFRVLRGGSWNGASVRCRVAHRGFNSPSYRIRNFGFRVVSFP
jgi:formylglycine-generating enzyme required for sulfatase activity